MHSYGDKFLKNRQIRNTPEEIDRLVNENWSLVPWVYEHFIAKNEAIMREKEDILSAGYIGLWEAAMAFDQERCAEDGEPIKFSTLAVGNIKHRMVRYIVCNDARYKFELNSISLNSMLSNKEFDKETELIDIIPDPKSIDDGNSETSIDVEVLMFQDWLKLRAKPREVAVLRMNLLGHMKYREIAEIYGVSRQRIEQIRSRALDSYNKWREDVKNQYYGNTLNTTIQINRNNYGIETTAKYVKSLMHVNNPEHLYRTFVRDTPDIANSFRKNSATRRVIEPLRGIGKSLNVIRELRPGKTNYIYRFFFVICKPGEEKVSLYSRDKDTDTFLWSYQYSDLLTSSPKDNMK